MFKTTHKHWELFVPEPNLVLTGGQIILLDIPNKIFKLLISYFNALLIEEKIVIPFFQNASIVFVSFTFLI